MSQFPLLTTLAAVAFWEDIDEQTLAAPAAAVTFSGIVATFTFFRMTAYDQQDATPGDRLLRLNNDGGGNYEDQFITAVAGVDAGARNTAQTSIRVDARIGAAASEEGSIVVLIAKPIAGDEGQVVSETSPANVAASLVLGLVGGQWNNAAALINRIDLLTSAGNLNTDTRILLEGGEPA